jgi:hypothetical protein
MIDRQYSSYYFLASELSTEKKKNILDRHIIYEKVMWILGILRFKSIHLLFYIFMHIIHMYISNNSNVILKYFHFFFTCRFLLRTPVLYCSCSATDHLRLKVCFLLGFIGWNLYLMWSSVNCRHNVRHIRTIPFLLPTILVWWQKKGYCSDMPNVVSAIDGTSHEI